MNVLLHFMHPTPLVVSESALWRPPRFPVPNDWFVSVDESGADLSRYGDDYWDFSAFGHPGFNFGKHNLSDSNKRLVKQALLLVFYHHNLFPRTIKSCSLHFHLLIKIAKVCNEQGILISDLSKFPRVHQSIADVLQCSKYEDYISILHKLRLYVDDLGFTIADEKTLGFLASQLKHREVIQHPYIPPRIWSYQANRLNECIDDFIQHQAAIKDAFNWLSEAYEYNTKLPIPKKYTSPFTQQNVYRRRILFDGDFNNFLKAYGLYDLLSKWLDIKKRSTVLNFSKILTLFRNASLFYILNFSLQRLSEAKSLKADCFKTEKDEKLGEISLIVGETTKTDPDSDARWVVPKTVEKAIKAAAFIAGLRKRHQPKIFVTPKGIETPLSLSTAAWEPWSARCDNETSQTLDYGKFSKVYPKLFDQKAITVTEQDWRIALSLTPNLDQKAGFGVGLPWRLSAHQLRRTTNVNMFASNMVSDNSLQWMMKHLSRNMTLYYGRNYTNLRLNSEAETAVIVESYRAIYRQLVVVIEDTVEYVRPHSKEMIPANVINLVEAHEEKQLTKLIKKGAVGCRQTLLGYCMKTGSCEYGGIESVAKCAGADRKGICADAIFERKNKTKLIKLKEAYEQELGALEQDSPRTNALKQEVYAIGVYLNVINQ